MIFSVEHIFPILCAGAHKLTGVPYFPHVLVIRDLKNTKRFNFTYLYVLLQGQDIMTENDPTEKIITSII